jgi:hypothetical protein
MEPTNHTTFRTLAVAAVLLVAVGALAGSLVTSAEKAAPDSRSFVGTSPATGATEGNVTDFAY